MLFNFFVSPIKQLLIENVLVSLWRMLFGFRIIEVWGDRGIGVIGNCQLPTRN